MITNLLVLLHIMVLHPLSPNRLYSSGIVHRQPHNLRTQSPSATTQASSESSQVHLVITPNNNISQSDHNLSSWITFLTLPTEPRRLRPQTRVKPNRPHSKVRKILPPSNKSVQFLLLRPVNQITEELLFPQTQLDYQRLNKLHPW